MEEINKNDISQIANKVGKFIILVFFIEYFSVVFINDSLANLLHGYEILGKRDPIEINMLVRVFQRALSLIIVGVFIFKINIKDIFSNKGEVYKLTLKAKTKLTLLFISIALLSSILSSFIMMTYDKHIMSIPMPETTLLISIFGVLIAPISEEILYRGIFLNELKGIGYLFSIVISSVYFGTAHGIGFLHAFIIGLMLGFVYVVTGNIKWSIIIHFLYNLILPLIKYSFLQLLPNMSANSGVLIIGIILLLIYLLISIKDKELKEFHNKVNMKNIINQFKRDKNKYIDFINEPEILLIIGCWIFMNIINLIAFVNIE